MNRTITAPARRSVIRSGVTALAVAAALLVPAAGHAQAATKHCAHHTTGVCKANSPHPKNTTAQCKDGTYSYSQHFSGTCSHHKGVRYWYK
ncbi:DUF3761 domain-containing protein [Streptomyces sp. NPDC001795]|uniref:DUF3761 domain-containing protein n=1 Tax=Streptomyces sp. NPDC001795 TaxID=3154525 RepID=UPI0033179504